MPRLKPLWLFLEELSRRLSVAEHLFVGVDFDGTLTPIVEHPDLAVLDARVRAALAALQQQRQVHLAILSGRRLDDLNEKVGMEHVFLAGSGGFETLSEQGRRQAHLPPTHTIPDELREALEAWAGRFKGAWFEDKGHAFAVHFRGMPQRFRTTFRSGIRRRVEPHRERARLMAGKMVYEVLPAIDWDKAAALKLWREAQGPGLLFYFGDDANDEPVFDEVKRLGGVAVSVGRMPSRAPYGVQNPDEVVWFLEWLAREWQETRKAPQPAATE